MVTGEWTTNDPPHRRIMHPAYVLPGCYVRVETQNDYAMQRSSVVSSWCPFVPLWIPTRLDFPRNGKFKDGRAVVVEMEFINTHHRYLIVHVRDKILGCVCPEWRRGAVECGVYKYGLIAAYDTRALHLKY